MAALRVDAHQHFWNLDRAPYPWLDRPDVAPIRRTYEPAELEPHLRAAGVDRTVVVQAANSYADTEHMLEQADRYPWIGAVVGWAPLLDHAAAARMLDRYAAHPKVRGVRHLIHDEPDPDWVVRDAVIAGLRLLEARRLSFDVVAVFPHHLRHVPTLAERLPDLTLVIDHLAKPPIATGEGMGEWRAQLAAAAAFPNVYAKVSGLNTAADPEAWDAAALRPSIEHALECFGADRCMWGSDWPVLELAGTYEQVWAATTEALSDLSPAERDAVLGGTAARVYRIEG